MTQLNSPAIASSIAGTSAHLFAGIEPMLVKFAKQTYARIPEAHRRHIEFEDVLQEARIRAWQAMEKYQPGRGTKMSSWVFGTLQQRMREVNAPFTDPGRNKSRTAQLVELDATAFSSRRHRNRTQSEGGLSTFDVAATAPRADRVASALSSFERAYRSGTDATQQILLDTLGFRVQVDMGPRIHRKVALRIAVKCRLSGDDIRVLRSTAAERCLLVAAKHSSSLPKIECRSCGNLFPVSQVGQFIDAKTLLCQDCVALELASEATCLGKEYDPATLECRQWCPQRSLCKQIIPEGGTMPVKAQSPAKKTAADSKGHKVGNLSMASEPMQIEQDDAHLSDADGAATDSLPDGVWDDDDADGDDDAAESAADGNESDEDETDDSDAGGDDDSEDDEGTPVMIPVNTQRAAPAKAAAPQPSRQKDQKTVSTSAAVRKTTETAPVKVKPRLKIVSRDSKPVQASAPAKATPASKTSSKPAVQAAGAKKPQPRKEVKAERDHATKPHYWTKESPFRPGTKLQKIVAKLEAVKTMKQSALDAMIEKQGMNRRGVYNNLRKQASFNGAWKWKFEAKAGMVTFEFTRRPSKAYVKAAGDPVRPAA